MSETIPTSPNKKIDVVIALDARGFLIGSVIALRLGAAFVPVRKPGKLPGECVQATYEKEYGKVRPNFTFTPSPTLFSLYTLFFDFSWSVVVTTGTNLTPPSISLSLSLRGSLPVADIFCFGGGDDTSRIGRVRDAGGRHSTWADGRCRRRHHCHGCVYCIFGPPSKHTDKRTVFFLLEPLHVLQVDRPRLQASS